MKRVLLAALLICAFAGFTLVLAQQRQVCDNALPNRLIVRERGRVSRGDPNPLNVREGVGTDNERVGQIPVGGVFYVLEGPECSPRYAWYRVEYTRPDGEILTGWIAEGEASSGSYFIETYPPGE